MIEYEIKLSGELSTNLLSESEQASGMPQYGTLVAPGVNAQYHQHCFCARLDMAVDGPRNTVVEVDVEPLPPGPANPYGNGFAPRKTLLRTEKQVLRQRRQRTACRRLFALFLLGALGFRFREGGFDRAPPKLGGGGSIEPPPKLGGGGSIEPPQNWGGGSIEPPQNLGGGSIEPLQNLGGGIDRALPKTGGGVR